MKLPNFSKLSMVKLPKPKAPQAKRLQATARRAQPTMDDFDDEPTTRLSSAFVVVLLLHVIFVGGIYAFNSIKSQRKSKELGLETVSPAVPKEPAAPAVMPVSTTAGPEVASTSVQPPPAVQSNLVSPISGGRIHKVQKNETLSQLASLYSVSVADLAKANGLEGGAKLRLEQPLNIPAARPAVSKAPTAEVKKTALVAKATPAPKSAATPEKARASSNPKTYTVMKGDNPVTIARRLGVSYEALLKLNKISDPRRLKPGQELQLPPKKAN